MDCRGGKKWNDTLRWMFKEKQKGPQIRGNKAQSEADRRLMWRSPGADSSPIMAVQVYGSFWGWDNVNSDRGGGVRLGGLGWRMLFHSQSVWHKGNKWVCTSFSAISYTQTLLILIHIQACHLIYFHLDSQVRKFGQVTKSTKRTCPWAAQFSLFSFFLLFSLCAFSASFRLQHFTLTTSQNHSSCLTSSFLKIQLYFALHMLPCLYWQMECHHISSSLWPWWDKWSKFDWPSTQSLHIRKPAKYLKQNDSFSNQTHDIFILYYP